MVQPTQPRSRRPLAGWKKAFLGLVTVALLLAGLEVLARIVQYTRALGARKTEPARSVETLKPHPVLHHTWVPSQATPDKYRSIEYLLTINSQSWVEDHDVTREKAAGVYRIFFVGDSNTLAAGARSK